MKSLSVLDVLTILIIVAVLLLLTIAPAANGQVQYPQTAKVGKVSVTVPADAEVRTTNTNLLLKRTNTSYYTSRSLDASIIVTSVEFKDVNGVRSGTRLTEFLTQFIASYGSIEHLATIKEDGRKGMNISTAVFHDTQLTRFTYVETRVFADDTHLYAVTIQSEVTPNKPLRTDDITEVLVSMKVN